jgi:dihydroorotase
MFRPPTLPDRSPPGRIAYLNARLIDPESGLDSPGALLTEGKRIVDFGPRLFQDGKPADSTIVDCGGNILCPGLIDMHVHFREPGHEHKETIETGSRSAAAGGVTTVVCMPNTSPVIDDVALIEFIERRARETSLIKVYPFAAITRGLQGKEMTEIGMLAEAGALGFTDDGLPVHDSLVMRRALSYASTFGMMVSQHAEDLSLSGCGCMAEGEVATRLGLPGIPDASEIVVIERDIRLVEITGGRYHVAHISTAEGVDAVRRAKRAGLPVSCEAAPHHFALNDSAVGDYRTFAKMAPPLRSEANRLAIVEGLKDGTIDAIATDHAPHDQESKRLPMERAANGVVGLETMLPISLELYHAGALDLRALLALMTVRPAHLLGLPQGRLQKGAPADLLVFDPTLSWQIDPKKFLSKSKNSPFDDRTVRGRALITAVDGRIVHRHQA